MELDSRVMQVYEYVREQIATGVPPTVREIAAALHIRSTSTVHRYLAELAEAGLIEKGNGQNRSIRLPAASSAASVPLVGKVAAGTPILAVENIEEYVMFGGNRYDPKELFALRVQGDSMQKIGIMNGDIVVVRSRPSAENGQIVVAMINDEATVKRFYKINGHFELHPENDSYSPIIADEVTILGLVVGVLRYY